MAYILSPGTFQKSCTLFSLFFLLCAQACTVAMQPSIVSPPGSSQFFAKTVRLQAVSKHTLIRGMGTLVGPEGLVATSFHNVAGTHNIQVLLADGSLRQAKLVASLPEKDLALIRLSSCPEALPYFQVSATAAHPGDALLAIGVDPGRNFMLRNGKVTSTNRSITVSDWALPKAGFTASDIAMRRGCSGGPMFNHQGKLMGITTAIALSEGASREASFAAPAAWLRDFLQKYYSENKSWNG